MDRPSYTLNTDRIPRRAFAAPHHRDAERDELQALTDAFLANGGKVEEVDRSVTTGNPAMTRKEANDAIIRSLQGGAR